MFRKRLITLCLSICALVSCQDVNVSRDLGFDHDKLDVIYGEDSRKDFYQENDIFLQSLSSSTVAIFKKDDLIEDTWSYKINRKTFGEEFGLCKSEKFIEQQLGPRCSGVLVASDLILTASHCVESIDQCKNQLRFSFDFSRKTGSSPSITELSKEGLYKCVKIVYQMDNAFEDIALVKLDRPVTDIEPVVFMSPKKSFKEGTEVFMSGFPSGLPLKLVDNAEVIRHGSLSFLTNLDSFGGNSGSPIYNREDGNLIGILSKGELDFEKRGQCYVSKKCSNFGCSGENVSYLDSVINVISDYNGIDQGPTDPQDTNYRPVIYSSFKKLTIPDGHYEGVSSTIRVDEEYKGRNVFVGIRLNHEWVGDLKVILKPPNSKKYTLMNLRAVSETEFSGVFGFDLVSDDSLSSLKVGVKPGIWTLQIVDLKPQDQGVLKNWRVIFN